MPEPVIILGGIGNGTVVAAAIDDSKLRGDHHWRVEGFLNDRQPAGSKIEGVPVLGGLDDARLWVEKGCWFINVIYRIDGQDYRIKRFRDLGIPQDRLATFVHPSAYVAGNVTLAPGAVIMPLAAISPGVEIGFGSIVMVSASVGHNTIIGDHCHLAAQSCIGSNVRLGLGVHVGLNATVRESVTLADYSTLAMGGALLDSIGEYEVWAGSPAKFLRFAQRELTP